MNHIRSNVLALLTVLLTYIAVAAPATAASARRFYLTKNTHDGLQALQACASGFHMASLWELYDVSNLRYDRVLGFVTTDSGFGPPSGAFGWIRTGHTPDVASIAGIGNCDAWTSNSAGYYGTMIELPVDWENLALGNPIGSWHTGVGECTFKAPVWCAQN